MSRIAEKHILKLIALLFSCFIWFYVFNGESITVSINVPYILIPPPGKAVSNLTPTDIKFTVEGARAFLKNIPPAEKLKMYIQLPKGKSSVPVNIKEANPILLPFGIKIVHVTPEIVNVSLEREIKKWVPVKIDLIGTWPLDSQIALAPDKVLIRGPYSILKKTGLLKTLPIEIEDVLDKPTQTISLKEIDPRITLENFSGEVELTYDSP